MHAIGSPVHWRLVIAYTISAAVAGIAGALFAQTNTLVTLGVFDFDQSAAVLMMLILGGAGWLYGGIRRRDALHGAAKRTGENEP